MNKYLKSQIKKYGAVYAVDFDGTLCISEYPKIIKPRLSVINFCKSAQRKGHKLILWTCREGQELEDAITFCKKYDLTFDAVNANLPDRIERFGGSDPRKVGADFYIDDRSRLPLIQSFLSYLNFM